MFFMSNPPVKSAERTLAIFEFFARVQRAMTVTEISKGMELPQSSTSALVKSLVSLGYFKYDSLNRTYYPTPRITLLGTWMRRRHQALGRIPQLLSTLVNNVSESGIMAMRNGIFVQYVIAQLSPDPLRLHVESGLLKPLVCTASGWALLMNADDNEIGKLVRRTCAETNSKHWQKTALKAPKNISDTRKNGYAISNGHGTIGASAISVPLPTEVCKTKLAVTVGGSSNRIISKKDIIVEAIDGFLKEVTEEAVDSLMVDVASPPYLDPGKIVDGELREG